MMAFPMNDDQLAEESAEAAVKTLADAIIGSSDDDDDDDENDQSESKVDKEPVIIMDVEDTKKDSEGDDSDSKAQNGEPMGILEAQLQEDEPQTPKTPRRPLFKRPKIEDLRKILGFPSADAAPQKQKPIPQEKPKAFQTMFNKPKPKFDVMPNGLQISLPLRREDKMRPFGFPMLPMQRTENRPFGFPDLVQAASSILRRAIIDDISANDISKDDKDDESNDDETQNEESNNDKDEDEDDDEDDEPLMIVPIPDGKDEPMIRSPFFRRFPLPLPFPVPKPMPVSRPRLPVPPLTPVAFFLPLAQQIMNNIMTRPTPRMQPPPPPLLPLTPVHHLVPIHHPMQNFIPIVPLQQNFMPVHQPMFQLQQPQSFHHIVPIHAPIFPMHQQTVHVPIFAPVPHNMPRPFMRPMQRRMPMPQPHPAMQRRAQMHNIMAQHHPMQQITPQLINPMMRRPEASTRPLSRMIRPPMGPMPSVILMMAPNQMPMMAQQQQQIPVFHRPQVSIMPHQGPRQMQMQMPAPQEEERIIFVREPEEQDEEQEVLLLVPTDEQEVVQRPPMMIPQPMSRAGHSPILNPLQRMKLLRELLMARQANRRPQIHPMAAQPRSPRIVEIVQQQLRIIPAHHQRGQQMQMQGHPSRVDASELHPVYVPYPGPQ